MQQLLPENTCRQSLNVWSNFFYSKNIITASRHVAPIKSIELVTTGTPKLSGSNPFLYVITAV